MSPLSASQEDIILQVLEEAGIKFLKEELFDHICTDVEHRMANGSTFELSLRESISSFGKEGLLKTERQTHFSIHQKNYFMKVLSISFLALMLLFSLEQVSGQDIPNMPPIDAKIVSSFGSKLHPILKKKKMHKGIDIAAPIGAPIKATANGEIIVAKENHRYGKHIEIKHKEGITTVYAHLSKINVEPGQSVRQGDIIGLVGTSGLSTSPHLHYEVKVNDKWVNPVPYLSLK